MPTARRTPKPLPRSPETMLAELGAARRLWDKLLADLAGPDITSQEWKGAALRLKRKERTILYLIPKLGSIEIAFVLGDRAVEAARKEPLPERLLEALNEARRYVEGTGLRFDVKGPADLPGIRTLTRIKLDH